MVEADPQQITAACQCAKGKGWRCGVGTERMPNAAWDGVGGVSISILFN